MLVYDCGKIWVKSDKNCKEMMNFAVWRIIGDRSDVMRDEIENKGDIGRLCGSKGKKWKWDFCVFCERADSSWVDLKWFLMDSDLSLYICSQLDQDSERDAKFSQFKSAEEMEIKCTADLWIKIVDDDEIVRICKAAMILCWLFFWVWREVFKLLI